MAGSQRWYLRALRTPRIERLCSRCHTQSLFASSDAFRVNAQKRRLDVWLIYHCEMCGRSWNCEVVARVTPDAVSDRLDAWHRNERDAAWACAFDLPRLKSLGLRVQTGVPYELVRPDEGERPVEVEVSMPFACGVRWDRFLAGALGLSRRRIKEAATSGVLALPQGVRSLRKLVVDGQRFRLLAGRVSPQSGGS